MRLAALLCLLLLACSPQGWSWQRFNTLRDFGSLTGTDGAGAPFANTVNGPFRFDDASYLWRSVAMPGAGATLQVAPDGREFASTYGLYTRASASGEWQLMPGSRELSLEFIGQDANRNVYGQTTFFSIPQGETKQYAVQLAGTDAWVPLAIDAKVFASLVFGPTGDVFAQSSNRSRLLAIKGTEISDAPQPSALNFDFEGHRYTAEIPFHVRAVTADGQLETWLTLTGAGTPVLERLVGFGKDHRFYAVAGSISSVTAGADFQSGDLISIGRGESEWRLAASPVSDGAGNAAGPGTFNAYGALIARDGTVLFAGCESGCTGDGNSFSYGVFRLTLGGQP